MRAIAPPRGLQKRADNVTKPGSGGVHPTEVIRGNEDQKRYCCRSGPRVRVGDGKGKSGIDERSQRMSSAVGFPCGGGSPDNPVRDGRRNGQTRSVTGRRGRPLATPDYVGLLQPNGSSGGACQGGAIVGPGPGHHHQAGNVAAAAFRPFRVPSHSQTAWPDLVPLGSPEPAPAGRAALAPDGPPPAGSGGRHVRRRSVHGRHRRHRLAGRANAGLRQSARRQRRSRRRSRHVRLRCRGGRTVRLRCAEPAGAAHTGPGSRSSARASARPRIVGASRWGGLNLMRGK